MEWNNKVLFLTDEEIKLLSIYLAYGSGLGIFIGIFIDNIPFGFSLGGVIFILLAITINILNRTKRNKKN